MKSRLFLLMLAVVCFLMCGLSVGYGCRLLFVHSGPQLAISAVGIDYGVLEPSQRAIRQVLLRNVGDEILIIKSVRKQCSCTVSRLSKSTIAPGMSCTLDIGIDTAGLSQGFTKEVYIESNSNSGSLAWITLNGYVKVGERLDANRLQLGSGRYGDTLTAQTYLIRDHGCNVGISGLRSHDPGVVLRAGEWSRYHELDRCPIVVTLAKVVKPPGDYDDTVDVTLSTGKELALPIVYDVGSSVRPEHASVIIRPAGTTLVSVNWPEGIRPSWRSIRSIDGSVRGFARTTSDDRAVLELKRAPGKQHGRKFGVLRVEYEVSPLGRLEQLIIPMHFTTIAK